MGELSSHLSQTEMRETKMGVLLHQHGRGRMGEHTSHLSQTVMGYMRMGEETSQLSRTKMGGRMTDGGISGPDLSSQRYSRLIGGTVTKNDWCDRHPWLISSLSIKYHLATDHHSTICLFEIIMWPISGTMYLVFLVGQAFRPARWDRD